MQGFHFGGGGQRHSGHKCSLNKEPKNTAIPTWFRVFTHATRNSCQILNNSIHIFRFSSNKKLVSFNVSHNVCFIDAIYKKIIKSIPAKRLIISSLKTE